MTEAETLKHIELLFKPIATLAAGQFPARGTLRDKLVAIVDAAGDAQTIAVSIKPPLFGLFATAAVEMWHRSVHSFLTSASLTTISPLWASVAGYYSSHYTVRAFAHLLGCFQLHTKRRIVRVAKESRQYLCTIERKNGGDREHSVYWKAVKGSPLFTNDPFFTKNEIGQARSDISHRALANYLDHVDQFATLRFLDEQTLKQRVRTISTMELSAAPIPDIARYPDTDSVQLVAYHRLVKFRKLLDDTLGSQNRFWTGNRVPGWTHEVVDFQVVEPKYAEILRSVV